MIRLRTPNKTDDIRPVVVITQVDDMTADLVIAELNSRGVPVVRFDAADFPSGLAVSALIGGGHGISGQLRTATRVADLSAVRSLYYRRPSGFAFPDLNQQDRRFTIAQTRYGLGGILTSLPGCFYVNHPHSIADAEFKPAQLAAAVTLGFNVPPTLITNELARAREFINMHGKTIYKALRCTDYEINGKPATVWTQEVAAQDLDERISGTMHLFQKMIRKRHDLRVTIAGRKVFPVRIDSPHVDWRTAYQEARYQSTDVPGHLVLKMRRYLTHFNLASGCFDFTIDTDGRPMFLECNANGQWAWLEAETGLSIASAFADLLERHRL